MNSLPEPKPPLAVGLDGAYVHAARREPRKEGWFEVIVGKSVNAAGEGKYVAFVHNDERPKRRLYETLKSQGLEPGQPVSFFSDGEVTMRRLQLYLSPQSEHILDWFHVTMKLTVMNQMRKGMVGTEPVAWLGAVEQDLDSLKWHLWNGNVDPALRLVDGLKTILGGDGISSERQKLLRTIREFGNYIAANQAFIPDYGDRHRNGERISTAFAESAVNQLVSRRMVKQQQMVRRDKTGMELRMKEPHEKGVAIHSAPSFAVGVVKYSLKRKQEHRRAGYRASKSCNRGADAVICSGRQYDLERYASSKLALRSRRPQARLETPCTRTGRPRRCLK